MSDMYQQGGAVAAVERLMKGYPVPVEYPLKKERPLLLWLLWVMPPAIHEIVRTLTRGGRVVNRHPIAADGMRAHQLTFEWWNQ